MRWESLFADLAAEIDAEADADRRGEVAERTRAEFGRLRLIDRLRPLLASIDRPIRIALPCEIVSGSILALGADWVLLSPAVSGSAELLVPLASVQWIDGLGPASAEPGWEGAVGARLGLRVALRRIARDRSVVGIRLMGGQDHHGRLARVAADHLALELVGDARPAAELAIPLTAIAYLRRP
jgi:hypothetical protein